MKINIKSSAPLLVTWGVVSSPVGRLVIGMTEKKQLCRIAFLPKGKAEAVITKWRKEWRKTEFIKGAIPKNWTQKAILLTGTKFQHTVWRAMAIVPKGYATTYGEIARFIGKPKSSRAVGAACGANPVPYIVPCHRVVAANGGLGGFSGGLDIKKKLLKLESNKSHVA
jgi:O-6-methylguanine DNA methyltransferase